MVHEVSGVIVPAQGTAYEKSTGWNQLVFICRMFITTTFTATTTMMMMMTPMIRVVFDIFEQCFCHIPTFQVGRQRPGRLLIVIIIMIIVMILWRDIWSDVWFYLIFSILCKYEHLLRILTVVNGKNDVKLSEQCRQWRVKKVSVVEPLP